MKLNYGEDDCRTVFFKFTNDDVVFGVEVLSNLMKLVDEEKIDVKKTNVSDHKFKEVADLLRNLKETRKHDFNEEFYERFLLLLKN